MQYTWTLRLGVALAFAATSLVQGAEYRAASGAVVITPEEALWAGGYASRTKPVSEKVHDLHAKGLLLADDQDRRFLLISLEVITLPAPFVESVTKRISEAHGLRREQIAVVCTHTHCGPPLHAIENEIIYPIDDEQVAALARYSEVLEGKILSLTAGLMENLQPAHLAFGNGNAGFGVNRRNNKEGEVGKPGFVAQGPVDHDVPVLRVTDPENKLTAVAFGYACHATTVELYQWSGDYPGFAQAELEASHPDVTAIFVTGCGGDINPLPRRELRLAQEYGKSLAGAVDDVLKTPMRPLTGPITAQLERISLDFDTLPTRETLQADLKGEEVYHARRAEILLEQLDNGIPIAPNYPVPIQTLQIGDSLNAIFLGGEAVVDYSLRFKKELGKESTWVATYANDLCAYIPSERVLAEGGYEGGKAMVYQGRPAHWAPGLEEKIVGEVHRQLSSDGAAK